MPRFFPFFSFFPTYFLLRLSFLFVSPHITSFSRLVLFLFIAVYINSLSLSPPALFFFLLLFFFLPFLYLSNSFCFVFRQGIGALLFTKLYLRHPVKAELTLPIREAPKSELIRL